MLNQPNQHNQNNQETKNKILKTAKILVVAGLVLTGLFIFFNYLLFLFLPFLIAWFIAFMIQPAVKFLNSKLKMPKKLVSVLFLLLLFSALVLIIFFSSRRIIFELNSLSQNFSVSDTVDKISEYINDFFYWIKKSQRFLDAETIEQLREMLNSEAENIIMQFGVDIAANIPAFIGSIVLAVPKILVFTLILIISTFYICLDYATISKFLVIQVPPKVRVVILDIKSRFLSAIYKYVRAYSIIVMITFFELCAGFFILGVDYALTLAFIVALIDILPILGTGTVLIPWGIFAIVQKDYYTGFGLLILYATVMIIRNIIEPKIVGKSLGLYPVATLIAIYVGYNIMGIAGVFLFPILIVLLKNLNDEGKIRLWKNIKDYDKTDKIKGEDGK
jgi:sporulation integral membrane protein YtvI